MSNRSPNYQRRYGVIQMLVACGLLLAALGGMALSHLGDDSIASDDTVERVAALKTVVSIHGAEIGALDTELALIRARQAGISDAATPQVSSGIDGRLFHMTGSSMVPTLHDGDLLVLDTDAYDVRGPER